METAVWTVSMVWWQWVIAIVVALFVWEKVEGVWYRAWHWITDKSHYLKK